MAILRRLTYVIAGLVTTLLVVLVAAVIVIQTECQKYSPAITERKFSSPTKGCSFGFSKVKDEMLSSSA